MTKTHLLITHYVGGSVAGVFDGFTRDLFERLSPKLPPAKLLRYDGNQVGDWVVIRLGIPPLSQTWRSVITANERGAAESLFVDEGRQLPWPLKFWRHVHRIQAEAPGRVAIVEDITFTTDSRLMDKLMRPVIRAQFKARGPKYRQVFGPPKAAPNPT